MPDETPQLSDVLDARRVIAPHLERTPLRRYPLLDELVGAAVYVKHENHLPTGAFKVRGGINLVARLDAETRAAGVYAASTGNHEVRRPADAEGYRQRTLAEAARDTTKLNTEADAIKQRTMAEAARDTTRLNTEAEAHRRTALAEAEARAQRMAASGAADAANATADGDAYAARATAQADAEAINARPAALSGENRTLIAANKLVDVLPSLVQASAHGIEGAQLTILNGSNGVSDVATGIAAQGLSIYHALQSALAGSANGGAGPSPRSTGAEEESARHTVK